MPSYQTIVKSKRVARDEGLQSAASYLEAKEKFDVYISSTASEIVANIAARKWTATEVVEAYIARAAYAHQLTNCLTEILFDSARQYAASLDQQFEKTGEVVGPMHGVPMSLKDHYNVTGLDSTCGYTQWANQPAANDATVVEVMREAGAVFIAKTNVPQTMMAFECANPLWGRTVNPHSDAYTCGGSSGGECALLAIDGSAIGWGSDVGGSLRIPVSFSGVYSLKPAAGRITTWGNKFPAPGETCFRTCLGPMARSVADVEAASRLLFGVQDPKHEIAPVPYRNVSLPSKLKFGYYTSDNLVKASPACKRAVVETVEALRKQGHECVEFVPPKADYAFSLFVALTSADGYKNLTRHLGSDPRESSLFLTTLGPRLPAPLRVFATWVINNLIGDEKFASIFSQSKYKPVADYNRLVEAKDLYNEFFYREVWEAHGFDAIIAPVQSTPSLPHGGCTTMSPLACATILYNVVDSPVGVVPVTHVDPVKDGLTDEWTNGPGLGSKLLERDLYHAKNAFYNPKKMEGLPIGVQIVGKRWEEEKVIEMMKVVDAALGKRPFGPNSWRGQRSLEKDS